MCIAAKLCFAQMRFQGRKSSYSMSVCCAHWSNKYLRSEERSFPSAWLRSRLRCPPDSRSIAVKVHISINHCLLSKARVKCRFRVLGKLLAFHLVCRLLLEKKHTHARHS